MHYSFDRTLFGITIALVIFGFFIFSSASLGLLARDGARFSSVAINQALFGIIGGMCIMFLLSTLHYRIWRKHAFYISLCALLLTCAVFIPPLGLEHGGALRWIDLGFISFQPSEFLKLASIIYIATWLSGTREHVNTFKKGTLPFVLLLGIIAIPLLLQPDMDTYFMIVVASTAMFVTAGGRFRDVCILGIICIVLIGALATQREYIQDRIAVFFNPALDPQGKGYQITQSLIAVGSGGVAGRGFGQSIQKFEYLPEPISDSIFAVYAEEFGFIGSCLLIFLFAIFAFRGYRIATHAHDAFGMLLVVGIVTLIISQTMLNIGAMIGLTPLSGLPLPFISHGGTALFMMLASVGIVLNVSKYQKKVPE